MLRAKSRILAGIAIVSVVAASVPEAAFATEGCNSGSIAVGGIQSFNPVIDNADLAKFSLVTDASGLTMQVIDDQNTTICDTAIWVGGNPTCSWVPVVGASYTVQVLRPASPAVLESAAAPSAPAGGSSSSSSSSSSSASSSAGTSSSAPPAEGDNVAVDGTQPGVGGPEATFDVCSVQSN